MNPLLARIQDQPVLIDEGYGGWLQACLAAVSERLDEVEKEAASAGGFWFDEDHWMSVYRPYVVKNGVLQIPVKGVLLNDFPYAIGGWATGYEYIWQAVKRGVDDSAVKGIAFIINSGGGMVSGNFDLVDRIYSVRSQKPMRAFAAEHAYSAAYNVGAAPGHLTVARTGGVGSIGVVITHIEISRALDADGVTVNLIRSKRDKMEMNSLEPLSEGARARAQARVDEFHSQFVAMVARNRGMSVEAVDATDAHTFMAQEALDNGLADEIGALDDAITAFEASFHEGDPQMADFTQAQYDEGVAAATAAGKAAGLAEGLTQGQASALARINAIIGSEAGKERPKAALNAALKTSMSAEEATEFLGTLDKETPATAAAPGAGAPAGMLTDAMNKSENPNIGAGDDKGSEASTADQDRALIQGFGLSGFKTTKE